MKQDNCDLCPDVGLADFIPVKIRSLFPGKALPCDFYFPTLLESEVQIQQEKILAFGDLYLEDDHLHLMERGIDEVYISSHDEQKFMDYLTGQTQKAVKSLTTPSERKTQLLYDNAELVVRKVFRGHPFEPGIAAGKRIIEDFAAHISSERVTAKALFSIFSKDYYTFSHCVQVATLGMYFGKYLGWSRAVIGEFGLGALFHDLGKNSISNEILNKAGKLEKHEFEIVRQHPFLGYQQLRKTKAFTQNQLFTILYREFKES